MMETKGPQGVFVAEKEPKNHPVEITENPSVFQSFGFPKLPWESNKYPLLHIGDDDYPNITPWKLNMEPENHLFEKENHLPNLHF